MYRQHRLYYQTYGRGAEALLAFHGYGQDHAVFQVMDQALGNRYTLYCFDLFFHGRSSGSSRKELVSLSEWCELIQHFLKTHAITRFSLMGYSMGGRFALALTGCLAARIDRLILMAPDGIKSSHWYQFASTSALGNYWLRATVTNPKPLFTAIRLARQLGLVEKGVLKFAQGHMDTRRKRHAVYSRWTALRNVKPDLRTVIRQCNEQHIRVEIYLGQYDQIVKAKPVTALRKKLKNSSLCYLSCGHSSLIHEVSQHLQKINPKPQR